MGRTVWWLSLIHISYKDVIDECWAEIEGRQGSGYAGIPFKFPALNDYATIERGELFIFGAEQKQGKSMMLLNCAVDLLSLIHIYLQKEEVPHLFDMLGFHSLFPNCM